MDHEEPGPDPDPQHWHRIHIFVRKRSKPSCPKRKTFTLVFFIYKICSIFCRRPFVINLISMRKKANIAEQSQREKNENLREKAAFKLFRNNTSEKKTFLQNCRETYLSSWPLLSESP